MSEDTCEDTKKWDESMDQRAGVLYDEYCIAVGGKAFNGDPLPKWEEFGKDPNKQKQANAWRRVAAVAFHMEQQGAWKGQVIH